MRDDSFLDVQTIELQERSFDDTPQINPFEAPAGVIDIANGGTGASSASGARNNLGAAQSGANSDITSLSGLTTPLSVAQGGTGANAAAGARTNLGAAAAANPAITGATIPLAKITGGGTDGSITVSAEGIITAYVLPT